MRGADIVFHVGFVRDIKRFAVFAHDARVAEWASAALDAVGKLDTSERRHGRTWFVGVDVLPNDADGSINGVSLDGPWAVTCSHWHRAQVSIVYDGYPKQDDGESDAAHRFRRNRDAAHMDGLLPEGPDKRRHLREPHGFILGLPLNDVAASPLVVWPGSQRIIRDAFAARFQGIAPADWGDADVTDAYQAARKTVFETCDRVEVITKPGQAVLLDRHLIHGVAPWIGPAVPEGRIVAYFRPFVAPSNWL